MENNMELFTAPATRDRRPQHLCLLSLESPRRIRRSQAVNATTLHPIKSAPTGIRHGQEVRKTVDAEQVTNMHLSHATAKGSHLLLSKDRHDRGVGQMPCDACTPNNDKRAFFEPQTGQSIFVEGKKL